MINKRELRIGNYFNNKFNPPIVALVVREIREDAILGIDLENKFNGSFEEEWINPIPLTEQWLLKLGFEKIMNGFNGFEINFKGIEYRIYDYLFKIYDYEEEIAIDVTLKYVHQIQNLFFALTGEELTIKENV